MEPTRNAAKETPVVLQKQSRRGEFCEGFAGRGTRFEQNTSCLVIHSIFQRENECFYPRMSSYTMTMMFTATSGTAEREREREREREKEREREFMFMFVFVCGEREREKRENHFTS